jgi:anaerobic magnesium-protoporphyrin IX monomethyl ester cyclase
MNTIAVYAPIIHLAKRANDFVLRLKKPEEELTFEFLYQLANNSYYPDMAANRNNAGSAPIAAAGYYLTSLLRMNNYDTILTASIDDDSLNTIAKQNPVAICISTTMIREKESLAATVQQIRKILKDILIIIGGVQVWKSYLWTQKADILARNNDISNDILFKNTETIFPCSKSEIDADVFVVSNHGGEMLLHILDEVIQKGTNYNFENIPNLALPDSYGHFYFTKRIEEEINYEQDYTRWELVDELPSIIPIRTSVGCPYRCGYCDFCFLYPKIIYRSSESIKAELRTIKNLLASHTHTKNRTINFSDDNIFITPKRADEICNTLIESDTGLFWSGFIRASSINSSNIGLIKRSNLERAWIGVESADQEQLNRMNKKQNIDIIKQGIELLDSENIATYMSYVIGYAGETDVSINNTIDFLNQLNVSNSSYMVFPLVIVPMSEISLPEMRQKWNVKGIFREWSHQTMDSKTAVEKSKLVFKSVNNIPYYYSQESIAFLQKYNPETRKKLYSLRQEITVALMEQTSWDNTARLFSELSLAMGVNSAPPNIAFRKEISFPDN